MEKIERVNLVDWIEMFDVKSIHHAQLSVVLNGRMVDYDLIICNE